MINPEHKLSLTKQAKARSGPVCLNNEFQFISGYAATSYAASFEGSEL